VLLTNTAQYNI